MKKLKRLIYCTVGIISTTILSFLYLYSYPYMLPIAEVSNLGTIANLLYEPAEWIREICDSYWLWSEDNYRHEGGTISPEDRFFFHTRRRNLKFYANGIKKEHKVYINGELNGIYRSWYQSGKKRSLIIYSKGEINGFFRKWYENGQLDSECFCVNDKNYGRGVAYFSNGIIESSCYYTNDRRNGVYFKNWKNGQLRCRTIYYNSESRIKSVWWSESGKKIATMTYRHDNPWDGVERWDELLVSWKNGQYVKTVNMKTGELISAEKTVSRINEQLDDMNWDIWMRCRE